MVQPNLRVSASVAPEDLGWPSHFFEETAGSIQDLTFRRHEQREFDRRAEFWMVYLLDTGTCVEYLRQRNSAVAARIAATPPADIRLCSIV